MDVKLQEVSLWDTETLVTMQKALSIIAEILMTGLDRIRFASPVGANLTSTLEKNQLFLNFQNPTLALSPSTFTVVLLHTVTHNSPLPKK